MAQLKEELAKLKQEMVRKDELFQQTKDELISDVVDSYAAMDELTLYLSSANSYVLK